MVTAGKLNTPGYLRTDSLGLDSPCKLNRNLIDLQDVVIPSVQARSVHMADQQSADMVIGIGQDRCMADTQTHPSEESTVTVLPPFDVLFQRYERGIYNLIYRMIGDVEDATDLTSQTFLHALRAYDRFRGEAQAYTWLYRIAVNLCKNYFRKRDREARFQLVSLDAPILSDGEEVAREIEDITHSPERFMEGKALQTVIQEAIMGLSSDLRAVILLRDVQGLSYQEIAEITGCSVEAVKSRIFRARGQLRKVLAPQLHAQTVDDAEPVEPEPAPRRKK